MQFSNDENIMGKWRMETYFKESKRLYSQVQYVNFEWNLVKSK